jgi:hypothetical protein
MAAVTKTRKSEKVTKDGSEAAKKKKTATKKSDTSKGKGKGKGKKKTKEPEPETCMICSILLTPDSYGPQRADNNETRAKYGPDQTLHCSAHSHPVHDSCISEWLQNLPGPRRTNPTHCLLCREQNSTICFPEGIESHERAFASTFRDRALQLPGSLLLANDERARAYMFMVERFEYPNPVREKVVETFGIWTHFNLREGSLLDEESRRRFEGYGERCFLEENGPVGQEPRASDRWLVQWDSAWGGEVDGVSEGR